MQLLNSELFILYRKFIINIINTAVMHNIIICTVIINGAQSQTLGTMFGGDINNFANFE